MILSIISIVVWVLTIIGFIAFNAIKKMERQEDIIRQQAEKLQDIYSVIAESDRLIVEIDQRGTFSSDDEVGFFFKFSVRPQGRQVLEQSLWSVSRQH
jgi:biopolymer transport protein ExbB/TolQ